MSASLPISASGVRSLPMSAPGGREDAHRHAAQCACPVRARVCALAGSLPPVVWRAARAGARRYDRARHAAALLGTAYAEPGLPAAQLLSALEDAVLAHLRQARRRPWTVRPGRLVGLLAAMLAEQARAAAEA